MLCWYFGGGPLGRLVPGNTFKTFVRKYFAINLVKCIRKNSVTMSNAV